MFLLDSSADSGWSYCGVLPEKTWSGFTIEDWAVFRQEAREYLGGAGLSPVPFPSGLMGALSYDLGLLFENIVSRHPSSGSSLPLFSFGYYDSVLAIDHANSRAFLCGREGSPSWKALKNASGASPAMALSSEPLTAVLPQSDHASSDYVQMVRRALELIRAGEIYEVNCSRRFHAACCLSSVEEVLLYRRLRAISPVPYGAFWDGRDMKILSASPELFLDLKNGRVATRPMKGTRPRGNDAASDEAFRQDLESSIKEKAELLMVTDLLRNDLGKVCSSGSVTVRELRAIESYRTVFQAVSCVEGIMEPGRDAFDLIEAAFPGGSVTGCPKHRAVRAIDDLELSRRGYYTGAMGFISSAGDMTLNMLIRTIVIDRHGAHFSAGGGIVADSDPLKEFEETALKAEGMARAL